MSFDMSDYKTVEQRILDFRTKHPDGTLSSRFLGIETTESGQFVVVEAAAYRDPDDTRPGIGLAWCAVPGLTPYTKNSELQNAETAARGRAIVAVGASDAKASRDEIQQVRDAPDRLPTQERNELRGYLKSLPDEEMQIASAWLLEHEVPSLKRPGITRAQAKALEAAIGAHDDA